jgi:hypothetical protein
MDEWFITKDSTKHWENALNWRRCKSNAKREIRQIKWRKMIRTTAFAIFWPNSICCNRSYALSFPGHC